MYFFWFWYCEPLCTFPFLSKWGHNNLVIYGYSIYIIIYIDCIHVFIFLYKITLFHYLNPSNHSTKSLYRIMLRKKLYLPIHN